MADQTQGHHPYYGGHINDQHVHSDNEQVSRGFAMRNPLLGANTPLPSSFMAPAAGTTGGFGSEFHAGGHLAERLPGEDAVHAERRFVPPATMGTRQHEWQAHHLDMMRGGEPSGPVMSAADQVAMLHLIRSQQQLLNQLHTQNAQLVQQNGIGAGFHGGSLWNSMAAMHTPQLAPAFPDGDLPLSSHAFGHDERTFHRPLEAYGNYDNTTYRGHQQPSFVVNETPVMEGRGELASHHQLSNDQSFGGLPNNRKTSSFYGFVEPSPSALSTPHQQPARLPPVSNFAPARPSMLGPAGDDISRISPPQHKRAHPSQVAGSTDAKQPRGRIDSAQPTPMMPQEELPTYPVPAPMLPANTRQPVYLHHQQLLQSTGLRTHNNIPSIKDYGLAHAVRQRFCAFLPAMQRFNDVVDQYNKNLLGTRQFFLALYELFYWSDSSHLLEMLKDHIPSHFDVNNVSDFYEQLRCTVEDRAKRYKYFGTMRDTLRSWAGKKDGEQDEDGESSDGDYEGPQVAPASKKTRWQPRRESTRTKAPSLIVKLPVDASALLSRLGAIDTTPDKPRSLKKRPRNGFKASERLSETSDADEGNEPTATRENAPDRPDLIVQEDPETGGDILINKKTNKPLPVSQTPACWIDHVGPIYKTRWEILARDSKPYIHEPCKQGFEHPGLVRQHHPPRAPAKGEKGNWCTDMLAKMENGDWQEWDHHESCKVTELNINYTMVKNGYVINDQESLDKIERAVRKGLEFKVQASLWEHAQMEQAGANASVSTSSAELKHDTDKTSVPAVASATSSRTKATATAPTVASKATSSTATSKAPAKKVPAKRANPSPSKYGLTPQKRRYVVAGAGDDDKEAEARATEILSSGGKGRK